MALHQDFPKSPYAIIDPAIRWFPADEALRDARIKLILAVRVVLKNGLGLLGVSAPEIM